MIEDTLQKIGLTPGEIKVYIALFHLGASSAGPIAQEAKVARSKLYEILDRLAKKGLSSHSVKNGVKYFSAAEPSRLLDFLRKKEEEIKLQEQEAEAIIPQLEKQFDLRESKQEAEVFEGLEGLKNVREKYIKLMKKGEEIYFFIVPSLVYDRMEKYYRDWNQRRIKKGINSFTIFTGEAREHPYVKEKLKEKNTFVRFLSKKIQTFSWIEIYRDTTVIATSHEKPMSIVINNKFITESIKAQFRLLWKISKE